LAASGAKGGRGSPGGTGAASRRILLTAGVTRNRSRSQAPQPSLFPGLSKTTGRTL